MAYMSKLERHCRWLDYCHNEWLRSLTNKSLAELQADLTHMENRLASMPKRHVHRIARQESNVRVMRAVIRQRTEVQA